MAGARWAQRELLDENPEAEFVVFAVWFNMLGGDSRGGWSPGLLYDPRVVHLWDSEQTLGRWFAEHPRFRDRGLAGAGVMWDTYLLFGPAASWGSDGPSPLAGAGYTIVRTREQLREQLEELLAETPVPVGR